jgi:hypothetical protein
MLVELRCACDVPAGLHTMNASAHAYTNNDALIPVGNAKLQLSTRIPNPRAVFDDFGLTVGRHVVHLNCTTVLSALLCVALYTVSLFVGPFSFSL